MLITHLIKKGAYSKVLGYTRKQLLNRLKPYMLPEMTLENRGIVWEIHHIIPIQKFFGITDERERAKQANALDNLIPLLLMEHKDVHTLITSGVEPKEAVKTIINKRNPRRVL